jgi:hypothetical protein
MRQSVRGVRACTPRAAIVRKSQEVIGFCVAGAGCGFEYCGGNQRPIDRDAVHAFGRRHWLRMTDDRSCADYTTTEEGGAPGSRHGSAAPDLRRIT